jgi:hypothetical protein
MPVRQLSRKFLKFGWNLVARRDLLVPCRVAFGDSYVACGDTAGLSVVGERSR